MGRRPQIKEWGEVERVIWKFKGRCPECLAPGETKMILRVRDNFWFYIYLRHGGKRHYVGKIPIHG